MYKLRGIVAEQITFGSYSYLALVHGNVSAWLEHFLLMGEYCSP